MPGLVDSLIDKIRRNELRDAVKAGRPIGFRKTRKPLEEQMPPLGREEKEALNRKLIYACKECSLDLIKKALEEGADVNATDEHGWTPLIFAAAVGHMEMAELLLSKGADVNHVDNQRWTALQAADARDRMEMIELLRKYGAAR